QGLLAAKAGAAFASPFIGRLDDISHDGMQLISDLVQIYENYAFGTEVLAASIDRREPDGRPPSDHHPVRATIRRRAPEP
ncbi:MAG: transaldolase family protein, partial [Phycisphaerales bacterium]